MQYDFEIEYEKGKEDKVVDALSRLPIVEFTDMFLSTVRTKLLEMIMKSLEVDTDLIALIESLKAKGTNEKGYSFIHE